MANVTVFPNPNFEKIMAENMVVVGSHRFSVRYVLGKFGPLHKMMNMIVQFSQRPLPDFRGVAGCTIERFWASEIL